MGSLPPTWVTISLRSPNAVALTIIEKKRISGEFAIAANVSFPANRWRMKETPKGRSANTRL